MEMGGGFNPILDLLFMISIHAPNHAKLQRIQGILALVIGWSIQGRGGHALSEKFQIILLNTFGSLPYVKVKI